MRSGESARFKRLARRPRRATTPPKLPTTPSTPAIGLNRTATPETPLASPTICGTRPLSGMFRSPPTMRRFPIRLRDGCNNRSPTASRRFPPRSTSRARISEPQGVITQTASSLSSEEPAPAYGALPIGHFEFRKMHLIGAFCARLSQSAVRAVLLPERSRSCPDAYVQAVFRDPLVFHPCSQRLQGANASDNPTDNHSRSPGGQNRSEEHTSELQSL